MPDRQQQQHISNFVFFLLKENFVQEHSVVLEQKHLHAEDAARCVRVRVRVGVCACVCE